MNNLSNYVRIVVMELKKPILALGYTEKEAEIYSKTFELGPANIDVIARASRIKRSTAYLLIKGLINKGILFEDNRKYGKLIFALEPEKLLGIVSAKQRQFRRLELEIGENMPEIQGVYQANGVLPKVRVYEGRRGLFDVRQDILKKNQEVLLWTNQEAEKKIFTDEYHKAFIEERVGKKIPIRVLAVNNSMGKDLKAKDSYQLRETKLLPLEMYFTAETYIYGNKVAILDYQKEIIGIIIESVSVAQSQRVFFETTWSNIKA